MTTTINASPTNGLVQTADGSGVLKVQSNGVTTNALAWVSFTGSTATIKASYNISSMTRTSTGAYQFAFTTPTTDANYALVTNSNSSSYLFGQQFNVASTTTTIYAVCTNSSTGTALDIPYGSIAVFGN